MSLSIKQIVMIKSIIVFLLLLAPFSLSDEARPVYIEITENSETKIGVKWKLPPVMTPSDEPLIYIKSDSCAQDGNTLGTRLLGSSEYTCKPALQNFLIKIDYPRSNPALTSLVVYKEIGGSVEQIFSGPEKTEILLGSGKSFYEIAKQYILAGIEHILIGYDHLLFVLCLILISKSTRTLIYAVTGFTIAHSITLSLATMNLIKVRTELVELLIALSIIILAREILFARKNKLELPLSIKFPISISAFFGLLHGFGFAVVLQELGLPFDMKINALLFFNIGVEIGQLIFIGIVLLIAIILRSNPLFSNHYLPFLNQLGIYFIGTISTFWFLQRTFALI